MKRRKIEFEKFGITAREAAENIGAAMRRLKKGSPKPMNKKFFFYSNQIWLEKVKQSLRDNLEDEEQYKIIDNPDIFEIWTCDKKEANYRITVEQIKD